MQILENLNFSNLNDAVKLSFHK